MVDVEQGALASLEQDDLVVVEGVVQEQRGVGHIGAQHVRVLEQLLDGCIDVDAAAVVDLDEDLVLLVKSTLDLLAQDRRIEEVLHADAETRDLVAVGRPDAATGRADLRLAEKALGDLVEDDVVRRDEVRTCTDHETGGVDALLVEAAHLLEEDGRIDHDPVADDRDDARRQDPAGQQVQGELAVTDDDGVAGVVAALVANDVVDTTAEKIGRLSLAFVTPLGTDEHDCGHVTKPYRLLGYAPDRREARALPRAVPESHAASTRGPSAHTSPATPTRPSGLSQKGSWWADRGLAYVQRWASTHAG